MDSSKKGQAVLVQMVEDRLVSTVISNDADLVAAIEARGYRMVGEETSGRLRPELRGAPKFSGLLGPMWGGENHPLRYEDIAAYGELAQ